MKKLYFILLSLLYTTTPIVRAQSGTAGPLTWSISGGTLTISGTGAMPNYTYAAHNRPPWYPYNTSITSLVIGNGITVIGSYALYGCSGLTGSLVIPNTVTTIGANAFSDCNGLTGSLTIPNTVTNINQNAFYNCSGFTGTLTIPNSLTSINDYVFDGCSGLTSVIIPNSVTSIGSCAFNRCSGLTSVQFNATACTTMGSSTYPVFSNCTALTTLTIGTNVTNIPACAFLKCNKLTSVVIPNSVISIGISAFNSCTGLTSLTIGNSTTSIGDGAFSGCNGLIGSLTIPNSVKSIGGSAFYGCSGLTGVLTIPNSVTSIGNSAFSGCSKLTSLTIGNSVETIDKYTFYNCSGLTSLTIGSGVASIAGSDSYGSGGAFQGCTGITTVNFNAVNCTSMQNGNNSIFPALTTLTIGSGVKTIPNYAFYNCKKLTGTLTLPSSVTSVGNYAFNGCTVLSITLDSPNSYSSIGNYAFYQCGGLSGALTIGNSGIPGVIGNYAFYGFSGLTSVTIGNSVTSIGDYAFYNCSGLAGALAVGNSVTSIGSSAFYGCIRLTALTLPSSLTTIGGNAFFGCNRLTGLLTIPNSITSIGAGAFQNCSSLTGSLTIPNSVTSIGSLAFSGCGGLTSLVIGSGVTSIGGNAFGNCSGLTTVNFNATNCASIANFNNSPVFNGCTALTTLIIGNGVTAIPNHLFYGCSGLTSVIIPNSVTSIGQEAFYYCDELASVTIGTGVTFVGASAFSYCKALKEVICHAAIPPTAGNYTFREVSITTCKLRVPSASVWLYKLADEWKNFTDLAAIDGSGGSAGCTPVATVAGSNLTWSFCSDGTLTINGTGAMPDYTSSSNPPWYGYRSSITSTVIGSGITSIGSYAFYNCTHTSVTIPNSVTSIGKAAFYGCNELTSLTIPNSVSVIPSEAFSNCSNLKSVTLGNNITEVDFKAFDKCTALTEVTLMSTTPPPWIGGSPFGNTQCTTWLGDVQCQFVASYNCVIRVPAASLATYRADPDWKNFGTNLVPIGGSAKTVNVTQAGNLKATLGAAASEAISSLTVTGMIDARDIRFIRDELSLETLNLSGTTIVAYTGTEGTETGTSRTYPAGEMPYRSFYDGQRSKKSLKSVVLPASLTSVGAYAFKECTGLPSIAIPNTVATIDEGAFYGCASLSAAAIPNAVTIIGPGAFQNCVKLTSVTIPEGVTRIGDRAFSGCTGLTDVWYNAVNSSVILFYYGSSPIGGPFYESSGTLHIGENVANIPGGCFWKGNFTGNLTIPNSVNSIGHRAFESIKFGTVTVGSTGATGALLTVTTSDINNWESGSISCATAIINRPITSAGGAYGVFSGVTSATIGSAVTSLGGRVFSNCSGLNHITSQAATPPDIQTSTFLNVPKTGNTLILPQGSEAAYYATTWRELMGGYHKVTYNPAGGTIDPAERYVRGGLALGVVPTPVRSGYSFGGWFTQQEGVGTQYIATTVINAPITLYAKWTATGSVASVTVSPATATVQKGKQQQFTANVNVAGGAPATVTWSVSGNTSSSTTINASGLLTVATGETSTTLTITATSTFDNAKKGTATVTVTSPVTPSVSSVTVAPASANVQKGQTQQFTANITATGGAATTVTWSVSGKSSTSTIINANGLLTVATGETSTMLTVTATSTFDNTKKGTATVTVTQAGTITVSGMVTNAPAGTKVELYRAQDGTIKAGVPGGYEYVKFTVTDANSRYQFTGLPAGVYIVLVIMSGYDAQPSEPLTLTDGSVPGTVNFTVDNNTHIITPGQAVTGVEDLFAPNMKIYPNPTAGSVHLTGVEGCTLRVFSEIGVVVHAQKITSSDETIELERLPAGVYFFRVEKDYQAKTLKVVKE